VVRIAHDILIAYQYNNYWSAHPCYCY